MGKFADFRTKRLVAGMHHADPERRIHAVQQAGQIGEQAIVVPLKHALHDDEPAVRAAAVHALGAIGDVNAGPAVLTLLADPDPTVRRVAATTVDGLDGTLDTSPLLLHLARLADKAPSDLAMRTHDVATELVALGRGTTIAGDVLRHAVRPVGGAMVRALIDVGDDGLSLLAATGPGLTTELREAIADALATRRSSSSEAIGLLLGLADDRTASVRSHAMKALASADRRTVAERLLARLQAATGLPRASDVETLGRLGDPHVVPQLVALLDTEDPAPAHLVVAIAGAVRELRDDDAIAGLVDRFRDTFDRPTARISTGLSAMVLGVLGDQSSAPRLTELLVGPGPPRVRSLATTRDPRSWVDRPALLRTIAATAADGAAYALGQLRDPATIPMLVDYLDRRESIVRSLGPLETDSQVLAHEAQVRAVGDLAAVVFEPYGKLARQPLLERAQVLDADHRQQWPLDAWAAVADRRAARGLDTLVDLRKQAANHLSGVYNGDRIARVRTRLP